MSSNGLLSFNSFLIIAVLLAFVVIGLAVYIITAGPRKDKKKAALYLEWEERLNLPRLGKDPKTNARAIQKFFDAEWPKKTPVSLTVTRTVEGLNPKLLFDFAEAATERLQPKRSKELFVPDMDEARRGTVSLYSVAEDSTEHTESVVRSKILVPLSDRLTEVPQIEFEAVGGGVGGVFFIGRDFASRDLDKDVVAKISELFGGEWAVTRPSENTLALRKAELEEEKEASIETMVADEENPFAARIESRRRQKSEEEEARLRHEEALEQKRRDAEAARQANERARRDQAIADGSVSPWVANPDGFLSAEIEVAADSSDLLSLDDEPDIFSRDGLGAPMMFSVYSNELLVEDDKRVRDFTSILIASLSVNLGGEWAVEYADSSLTFRRKL